MTQRRRKVNLHPRLKAVEKQARRSGYQISVTAAGYRRIQREYARRRVTRGRAIWTLATIGAVALFLLVWKGPYLLEGDYISKSDVRSGSAALITGLRTSLISFAAAIGAAFALVYTIRTYKLSRKGQITDRFTKSLERLGSDDIYGRIGGIMALEQIAYDAPEQAENVSQILIHFLRHHVTKKGEKKSKKGGKRKSANEMRVGRPGGRAPEDPVEADVQAALRAVTRYQMRALLEKRSRLGEMLAISVNTRGQHLDGAEINLSGGLKLSNAYLPFADLSEANLQDADLSFSILVGANLSQSSFSRANLESCDLDGADFSGSMMWETNLSRTSLHNCKFNKATMTDVRLEWARLYKADLTGAKLINANLANATFTGCILKDANLGRADLRGTDLSEAYMEGASLGNAVLDRHTKLPDSILSTLSDKQKAALNGESDPSC